MIETCCKALTIQDKPVPKGDLICGQERPLVGIIKAASALKTVMAV
jgi:hypothetical protein